MEPPGGRDSRFNLGYSMNLLSGETSPEIYGNPNLGRPSTSLQQLSPRHTMVGGSCGSRGGGGGGSGALKTDMYDERAMSGQGMGLDTCVSDISEDTYGSMQSKKSPPSNGKKTKGRVKIKMEYIENKLRRYTTFSKRKTGIMKKAYELSTLTGTQVMLLVASETGHVYTFATRKLQPMITSEAGKALIQTCLNSPDPPAGSAGGDQRMSATGFEETELTYNISDDDSKDGAESGTSESSEEVEDNCTDPLEIPSNFVSEQKVGTNVEQESFTLPVRLKDGRPAIASSKPPVQKHLKMEIHEKPEPIDDDEEEEEQVQQQKPPRQQKPQQQLQPQKLLQQLQQQRQSNVPLVATTTNSSCSTSNTLQNTSIPATATTEQMQGAQAVPLILQTPNGMAYASTPEGMLIGVLQGPNMPQPQLVTIPLTMTSTQNQNGDVKRG